jgi:hypothetical protein
MKTKHTEALQHSAQPWLRDHYAALRAEAGPRWEHTRAVVVPVLADTSHKVRHDVLPAAAQLSTRVADGAKSRTAPLRAEVSDRAAATLAAAKGGVTARQIEHLQRRGGHSRRKVWFIGGAAALGAAMGTAAVLWQRARHRDWVEDDAVHGVLEGDGATSADPKPEPLDTTSPAGADMGTDTSADAFHVNHDDPSDADTGLDEADTTPSSGRSRH